MRKYKNINTFRVRKFSKQYNFRANRNHLNLIEYARILRHNQTLAEAIFWSRVRGRRWRKLKFRRQHQIGEFIVDFYCDELRLVIELDGGIHFRRLIARRDKEKDMYFLAIGMKVLRISNGMILNNVDEALIYVGEQLEGLGIKF